MHKYRVLLVDDEKFVRARLRKLIETSDLPFIVENEAGNGNEALQLIGEHPPEVVFTDIRMPQMDGLAFIKELRERFPEMYILILTGYERFEYARQALRYKVNEFLLKPVSAADMKEVLSKADEELRRQRFTEENYMQAVQAVIGNTLSDLLEKKTDHESLLRYLEHADFPLFGESCRLAVASAVNANQPIFPGETGFSGPHQLPVWLVNDRSRMPEIKLPLRIGMSRSFVFHRGKPELLRIAYAQAIGALSRGWFEGASLLWADIADSDKTDEKGIDGYSLIKKIVREVEEGLPDRAKEHLTEVFARFRAIGRADLALLQQIVQECSDRLHFLTGESILSDKQTALSWLMESTTLQELEFRLYSMVSDVSAVLGSRRKDGNPFVHKALDFIHRHFNEEITLVRISEHVALNQNYFCGLFKAATGRSFKQYVSHYRMERAKELLLEGCWKPSEVSYMVGYTDEKYFSRVFKKAAGCPPNQFGKNRQAAL